MVLKSDASAPTIYNLQFFMKPSDLLTRALTATVGIPLALLVVYLGGWAFEIVAVLLAGACLWEVCRACRSVDTPLLEPLAFAGLAACFVALWPRHGIVKKDGFLELFALSQIIPHPFAYIAPFAFVAIACVLAVLLYATPRKITLQGVALTVLATLYLGLWAFLPLLRARGVEWIWLLLAGVWGGDTFAYFAGRKFGRVKLTPLSPGKSREGAIASVIASVVLCALLGTFWPWVGLGRGAIYGLVIGVAAPLGDLVESFWKRELGVKDFGTVLPGHGGFFDRCDSLILSAFAAYCFLLCIANQSR